MWGYKVGFGMVWYTLVRKVRFCIAGQVSVVGYWIEVGCGWIEGGCGWKKDGCGWVGDGYGWIEDGCDWIKGKHGRIEGVVVRSGYRLGVDYGRGLEITLERHWI